MTHSGHRRTEIPQRGRAVTVYYRSVPSAGGAEYRESLRSKRAYSHKYMCGLGEEEPLSDMRERSYSFIDWIIWAVLVIAIIWIGWLIVSNLPLLLGLQTHH